MTTDFRALCAELTDVLDGLFEDSEISGEIRRSHSLEEYLTRARAALADEPAAPQPPAEGEVAELVTWLREGADDWSRANPLGCQGELFSRAAELLERLSQPQPLANREVGKPVAWMCPAEPYFDGNKWHDQWQVTLDQRLAEYWTRPGKPTPLFTRAAELLQREALVPPANGEVAELVARLLDMHTVPTLQERRLAADLLQRLSPPQPVPVSERWPEFSDCDDTDRVWCWNWAIGTWRINRINRSIHSHWLPAHALPLPGAD